MAGGYSHQPPGVDGVAGLVKDLQAQIAAIRSGAGIRSAVISDAQLIFTTADGEGIGTFGTFPLSSLDGDLNRTSDTAKGALFEADDGQNLLLAVQYESDGSTEVGLGSDIILIRADTYGDMISGGSLRLQAGTEMDLHSGGRLGLWGLPTTSSAANLFLGTVGADWTVAKSTSSLKYKQDVEDADVDPAEVLKLTARTWRDKGEVEHDPDSDKRFIGFIAEELDEHPSLRQFVVYDENGDPDAIQYDRLTVALLAVIKDQQARIDNHEERLTKLEGARK